MTATVTATFADSDAARQAALELERRGIEANRIRFENAPVAPTNRNMAAADIGVGTEAGKRALGGGVLGAIVVAAVAIGVVLIIQPDELALALVIAAIGGAIVGAILGGIWSSYSKLPVSSEAYDTFKADAGGATLVVTVADLSAADEIRSVVEDLDPTGVMVDGAGPGR